MMRDILKTVSYSIMHLIVAMGVAYALTRNWQIALGIGLIEPMVQTVAYAMHEKAWSWRGKKPLKTSGHDDIHAYSYSRAAGAAEHTESRTPFVVQRHRG
ncbi:MAG: DUF2061 domain-containing protein [Pseudomonadota bacterium]